MKSDITQYSHLVIGLGQVGRALTAVLSAGNLTVSGLDKGDSLLRTAGPYDALHVCFPYGETFIEEVRGYQRMYTHEHTLVIVHSTVPVGTTAQLHAIHSPIRGVHPNLAEGIRTFVKYVGGPRAREAAQLFEALGIRTRVYERSQTTELAKLLDTTYYGLAIVFAKEAARLCEQYGLQYREVYALPNISYNEGYTALGMPHVVRPVLQAVPGKIGGHCIINNCRLLDSRVSDFILDMNEGF